ncbi:unnamed protein product [Candidula unifasciata]|uniref:G-protein coupled receptors family 1 profile domain-containing protein n=1 Tax=Candidula unifasciata TaxID=100452 RepID=A0A8S3YX32_9EUPU|nr:unnamed protein product [Candidula unifasciata]
MKSQTLDVSESVLFCAILTVHVTGVVTNSLNVRVFLRQGVSSDSTTVSMFALAVSNLLGSLLIIPKALCFYVDKYVQIENYAEDSCNTWSELTLAYPHIMFSRITCWIIVYISVERALSVLIPLRVKLFITSKTASFVMLTIYVFYICFHVPFGANVRIVLAQEPAINGTVTAISQETALGKVFLKINSLLGNTILTTTAMIIIAVTTVVMLRRLRSLGKWRNAQPSSVMVFSLESAMPAVHVSPYVSMSRKDKEVIKMVSTITGVYLVCLSGSHVPGMCICFIPEMYLNGVNSALFHLAYSLKYLFDGINSSVNFFFYFRLSRKYRDTFCKLFSSSKWTTDR